MKGVITGRIGVGKTTVCQQVLDGARQRGYIVRGILTPVICDGNGAKVGIAIVDVATGERKQLGLVGRRSGALQVGKYAFNVEALQWGCRILDQAWTEGCDLLLVDEIGHLELERGEGFVQALRALQTEAFPYTLVVVRDSLLGLLRQRCPGVRITEFLVTEENRQRIAGDITEWLLVTPARAGAIHL